jgi:hypothetical protein
MYYYMCAKHKAVLSPPHLGVRCVCVCVVGRCERAVRASRGAAGATPSRQPRSHSRRTDPALVAAPSPAATQGVFRGDARTSSPPAQMGLGLPNMPA